MPVKPTSSTDLIIRADADSRMGTGHVMRCIALGQAWQDAGGNVVFFTACDNQQLLRRLKEERFSIEILRESADFFQEIERGAPDSVKPWVVLDGYHFNLDCQRRVKAAGHKVLVVDDYNHLQQYECNILLNQNVDALKLDYSLNSDALRLLGTDYAMLRREFRSAARLGREIPEIGENVLVTLGGADPDNLSLKVIESLKQTGISDLHVKVVIGPANPYRIELEMAAKSEGMTIELLSGIKDMTPLMHWADLAVSAGGSTCWELCCLGVPFITLVIAENQRGLSMELDKRDVAPCLGENPTRDAIAKRIEGLLESPGTRERFGCNAQKLVDGFGVDRALFRAAKDAALDLFVNRLSFRNVEKRDSELLWIWANDSTVREQCYNPEAIPWESHAQWFLKKIADPDVLMLMLELDGCPVGQVRYDCDKTVAHIGFSIERKFRGLGFGSRIIKDSLEAAFSTLDVDSIQAEVFVDNAASNRVFSECGFQFVEQVDLYGVPSNTYVKERK